MSGGSMNYLYSKVLHNAEFPCDTPEREAFAKHLKLVAQALHDIEWVDSGDYGPGDENAAIAACLQTPLRAAATMALHALHKPPGQNYSSDEMDAAANALREALKDQAE